MPAREVFKLMQQTPYGDPNGPGYRRLRYVRYADDFLLGFVGPKSEAKEIKDKLATFLVQTLKLELSPHKTLITHATTEEARFLVYGMTAGHANDRHDASGRRAINGRIRLRVRADFVEAKCNRYKRGGEVHHRAELMGLSDFHVVSTYQSEHRGFVLYYQLADNLFWLNKLHRPLVPRLL